MAKNLVHMDGDHLSVVVTNPTVPASGDPVRFGPLVGVALVNEADGGNAAGYTSVDFGRRVWDVSVKAVNDGGNSAVVVGDAIYYVDGDTPHLSKKASGYYVGVALEAINSGSTDTINVRFGDSPGSGSVASGGINTTQLAAGAVTAPKLSTNLAIGYIPLPLDRWRIITTNDISAKNAADGGLVSLDTDPTYKRVNGATDKKTRLAWAATSVVEVQQDFAYPPDLDDTAALTIHLLSGVGGAMDTPAIAVGYFEGVGDTNAGGNTPSLAQTVADKIVTIAAADVGAYPQGAAVSLIPAAHANDAIYIYAAWLEYARKS